MEQFKNKYSFNKRKDESESVIKNIRIEYLLLFKNTTTELPDVDKCKYLVPKSMSNHSIFIYYS